MAEMVVMSAYRLTRRQRAFVKATLEGLAPSAAYIAAGYKVDTLSKRNVTSNAQHVKNNTYVARAIAKGDEAADNKAVKAAVFTREKALLWAEEDRRDARKAGQYGSAVSSNRLACDVAKLITRQEHIVVETIPNMSDSDLDAFISRLKDDIGETAGNA